MKGMFETMTRGRSPTRSTDRQSRSSRKNGAAAVDKDPAQRYQSREATGAYHIPSSNLQKTRLEIVEAPRRPMPTRSHRGKPTRSKSVEHTGFFSSLFGGLAAFNELMVDRCEECGDDDISYTYGGNYSKSTTTKSSSGNDDMNTMEESTLNNSTILSETLLHRDWSIPSNPIYRDVNDATNSGLLGAAAPPATDQGLPQNSNPHDDAPRDGVPVTSEDMLHRRPSSRRCSRSRGRRRSQLHDGNGATLSTNVNDKDHRSGGYQPVTRARSRGAAAMRRPRSTKRAPLKDADDSLQHSSRSKSLSHTNNNSLKRSSSSHKRKTGRAGSGPPSSTRRGRSRSQRRERIRSKSRGPKPGKNTVPSSNASRDKSLSVRSRRTANSRRSRASARSRPRGRSPNRHRPSAPRSRSRRRGNRSIRENNSERRGMMSRLRDGLRSPKSPKASLEEETRDDVEHFTFEDDSKNEESLNIETMFGTRTIPADLPVPHNSKERLTPRSASKMGSIRTGLFAWRKSKGGKHERSVMGEESRDDVHSPARVYDISVVPTKSEDLPVPSIDDSEKSAVVFPVPNEEGQEIAIQDEEHCYEDPANVHSMLTMPSFEQHKDETIHNDTIVDDDQGAIAIVLTQTDDGDLVTDDGAIYAVPKDAAER